MKVLEGEINPEILEVLERGRTWLDSLDKSKFKLFGEADFTQYYTSTEYLESIDKEEHIGFPEKKHGIDIIMTESTEVKERSTVREIILKLNQLIGSRNSAVFMYYPPGGYMGWHDNHNASGYNILISYSKNGNGYFRYVDPETKEIITLHDKPGWNVKVGYYGSGENGESTYWHCAYTDEERITFGFIIPDKNLWEMSCEDLVA